MIIPKVIADELNRRSRIRNTLTHSSDPKMGFGHSDPREDAHNLSTVPDFIALVYRDDPEAGARVIDRLPVNTFKDDG